MLRVGSGRIAAVVVVVLAAAACGGPRPTTPRRPLPACRIAVDDFDKVRAALGYDKIDVYGISYGVSSGLAYIQRHGDHVRAAVFDSGSMLDYHIYEQVPHSAWQSLQRLFERCAADSSCRKA